MKSYKSTPCLVWFWYFYSQGTVMETEHDKALSKAKIHLMTKPDSVFFTTIVFSVKHLWDFNIPTAATNGTEIRYNPKFFMSLSQEERVFLLLHESMHIAYMHMLRLKERDHGKWNMAADYVINLMLVDRKYVMPKCGLLDRRYRGMSTEEVYDLLPDNKTIPQELSDLEEGPTNEEDAADIEEAVKEILVRAQVASQQANEKPGAIPGDIQAYLDKLLKPKLPYTVILKRFIYEQARNDYTYRKPNRRHYPDHYLPNLYSEKLTDIAIAVDVSGSVTQQTFDAIISEIGSIFKMCKPEKITVLHFDTEIKEVNVVKSFKDLTNIQFTGRGGTHISPIINWYQKNKPKVFLIFTDGYFSFPPEMLKSVNNVVWIIYDHPDFQTKFGKVIHYDL